METDYKKELSGANTRTLVEFLKANRNNPEALKELGYSKADADAYCAAFPIK